MIVLDYDKQTVPSIELVKVVRVVTNEYILIIYIYKDTCIYIHIHTCVYIYIHIHRRMCKWLTFGANPSDSSQNWINKASEKNRPDWDWLKEQQWLHLYVDMSLQMYILVIYMWFVHVYVSSL